MKRRAKWDWCLRFIPVAKERSKSAGIHIENVEGLRDLLQPGFDLVGFGRVPFACDLDAGLNFADSDRREMQIGIGHAFQPSDHGTMRSRPPQFRNDVRV